MDKLYLVNITWHQRHKDIVQVSSTGYRLKYLEETGWFFTYNDVMRYIQKKAKKEKIYNVIIDEFKFKETKNYKANE